MKSLVEKYSELIVEVVVVVVVVVVVGVVVVVVVLGQTIRSISSNTLANDCCAFCG